MNWGIVLFLTAAIILAVWGGRAKLNYFRGLQRRATAELNARRRLESQVDARDSTTPVTVMLTPPLVEALDRFISTAGEVRFRDRGEAVKMLMTETLMGLELLQADDRPKEAEPRR